MKKTLAIVLALLMLVSCTAMAEEDLFAEPWTLTWVSWSSGEIEDENVAEVWLEEKFNVEITATRIDLSNSEQLNLMLASGEMPEAGWIIGLSPTTAYTEQGLTRLISEEMVRKYAPRYAAEMDKNPIGWQFHRDPETGDLMALTGMTKGSAKPDIAVRLDWMENLGLEIPEYYPMPNLEGTIFEGKIFRSDYQYTADELYDLMYAFSHNDPDGNGADDTTGLVIDNTYTGFTAGFMQNMFSMHSSASLDWNGYNDEGKFELYYSSDRYKEYLAYWAKCYADDLIDQEFVTLSRSAAWEKYGNGTAGICGSMTTINPITMTERPPFSPVRMDPVNAKVLVLPTPTANDGSYISQNYSLTPFNYLFHVREDVSDEKLAKILTMWDFMNFDEEAQIFLRAGQEGVHHTKNPTGGYVLMNGVSAGKEWGFSVYNSNYIQTDMSYAFVTSKYVAEMQAWIDGIYEGKVMPSFRSNLFTNEATEAYNEARELYATPVSTVASEYRTAVVTGELDLESTWDAYLEDLYANGYQELCDAYEALPTYDQFIAGEY